MKCADKEEQDVLIDLLTKFVIIFGISIFTNELFYISLIINRYTEEHGWYVFLARCFENFSNIAALYLTHKMGEKWYHRLCWKIHKCLRNSCIITRTIDKKIKNDTKKYAHAQVELQVNMDDVPSGSIEESGEVTSV